MRVRLGPLANSRALARVREPWRVLVPLLLVHWVALALYTTTVRHNGWLFYQGGDQIWFWTSSWLLGHGWITLTPTAPGWLLPLLPIASIAGPGFLAGLPAVMLLQILVLAPIALWCVYELGARIGGRLVGYGAAFLWTIGPYAAIPLFVHRYHAKYVEQFLPQPLGLTGMADYAGTVMILVSAVFVLRAYEGRDSGAAVVAGLAAGYAFLLKTSNVIFLGAPLVALLLGRRWREALAGAVAVAPAVGALAIWNLRGQGYVPAFSYEQRRVALGGDSLLTPYHRYVHIDWHHLHDNVLGIAEAFFSLRVLEWLLVAGAIAVARRSIPTAVFLSIWFWSFFVLKGAAFQSSVDSGSFFRFLLPAVPALVVMTASLALLVPRSKKLLLGHFAPPLVRPVRTRIVAGTAVLLGLAPLVAAAAVQPLHGPEHTVRVNGIGVVVEPALDLHAEVRSDRVRLEWSPTRQAGSSVFYKLLRKRGSVDAFCGGPPGAAECNVDRTVARVTRQTTAVDQPPPGRWTYRLGVGANYVDNPRLGDIFVVSEPVTVKVP